MIFLGVDPGVKGGVALLDENGCVLRATKMPATERDILEMIRDARKTASAGYTDIRAVLERVSSSPQMGVASAFTFGGGYYGLRMALMAFDVPFDLVAPATWQRVMGCFTSGDKNVTKQRAQQLFPTIKITHAIADALLLAEYGRRLERGK